MDREALSRNLPVRWVSVCGRYRVRISDECLREMLTLSRRHLPREVGASVYGSYSRDGFEASVLGNSPAAPDSVSGRFSFRRGVEGATHFFSDLFKKTRGRQHYVGEWHSHPEGPAAPSALDNRSLRAIAADQSTDCHECILLLIGGNIEEAPMLGVYVYSRDSRGRVDLQPENGENHERRPTDCAQHT